MVCAYFRFVEGSAKGLAQGTVRSAVDEFREQALRCPLPAAVELIGEKWAFLIVRGAFNDLHHFEEFQAGLGIARNILSDRLSKLVSGGILKREPDPSDKRKVVYSLTSKGEALMPVVLALRQWGEAWGSGPADIVLVDRESGIPVRKICVESEDGRVLNKHDDLIWVHRSEAQPVRKGRAA
ncbi:MAG: helix-turn-helix transcriptional regulator [Sphingomonas sp.]|nr:helix-turn-helix transcriptional regulator [Sphingomonas sp.]